MMGGIGRIGSGGINRVDTKVDKKEEKKVEKRGLSDETLKKLASEDVEKPQERTFDARGIDIRSVEFTRRIRLMKKAGEIVKRTMEINEKKVEQIKRMIEAGEYKIDLDKLAEKLIDDGVIDRLFSIE